MEYSINITGTAEDLLEVLAFIRNRRPNVVPVDLQRTGSENPSEVETPLPTAKLCTVCGLPFNPKRRKSEYCSSKCYQKKYWKDHHKADPKKVAEAPAAEPEPEPVIDTDHIWCCATCGNPFVPESRSDKYCSYACRSKSGKSKKAKPSDDEDDE